MKNAKLEKTDTELKENITLNEYNKTHEDLKINIDKLREQLKEQQTKEI